MLNVDLRRLPKRIFTMAVCVLGATTSWAASQDQRLARLAEEVADKGWVAYSARSENGTWDLLVSQPDGSDRRNITHTSDLEEAGPRWSPDGTRLLYRAMPAGTTVHHDRWGFQGRQCRRTVTTWPPTQTRAGIGRGAAPRSIAFTLITCRSPSPRDTTCASVSDGVT